VAPPRADKVRNRARILEAAEQVLAAGGPAASTEEIARVAGVGAGTVFRHFPTKQELIRGVFIARLRRLTDEVTRLTGDDDPAAGLEALVRQAVEQAAFKTALAGMLAEAGGNATEAAAEVRDDLLAALEALLDSARRAGTVRPELRTTDLIALLAGASRAAEYTGDDPHARDRIAAVLLDGMRPPPA
jgi:AcrR family transcriptional regulator